jgi:hypothetical protein
MPVPVVPMVAFSLPVPPTDDGAPSVSQTARQPAHSSAMYFYRTSPPPPPPEMPTARPSSVPPNTPADVAAPPRTPAVASFHYHFFPSPSASSTQQQQPRTPERRAEEAEPLQRVTRRASALTEQQAALQRESMRTEMRVRLTDVMAERRQSPRSLRSRQAVLLAMRQRLDDVLAADRGGHDDHHFARRMRVLDEVRGHMREMEAARGATRNCVQNCTLLHKFKVKTVGRAETAADGGGGGGGGDGDEEGAGDKCTICFCGKLPFILCRS